MSLNLDASTTSLRKGWMLRRLIATVSRENCRWSVQQLVASLHKRISPQVHQRMVNENLLNFSRFPSTFKAESRVITKACIWKHGLHRMAWPLLNILFVLALAHQWNWVGVTPETHVCGTFVKPCECTHDSTGFGERKRKEAFQLGKDIIGRQGRQMSFCKEKNSKENSLFSAPPGLLWLKHEWNKSSNSRPMLRKERWNDQWAINWY